MALLKLAWVLARTWVLFCIGWLVLLTACVIIAGNSHGTPLEMALGVLALGTLALSGWAVASVKGALAGVVQHPALRKVMVGAFALVQAAACVALGFMALVVFNR